jgi:hypothetical protein
MGGHLEFFYLHFFFYELFSIFSGGVFVWDFLLFSTWGTLAGLVSGNHF